MMLIAIISRKIKDVRFVNLIRLFLKAGYMEDWKYYGTYSGCPQGGLCRARHNEPYDEIDVMPRYVQYSQEQYNGEPGALRGACPVL